MILMQVKYLRLDKNSFCSINEWSVLKSPVNSSTPNSQTQTNPTPKLLAALRLVLTPLVRLLIAKGVNFQTTNELLKQVYVDAAKKHFADADATDSKLSLLTGLNRKEIRRLTSDEEAMATGDSVTSFAAAVHTAWRTQRRFRTRDGDPRILPRADMAAAGKPSFDELVRSVTQDHRPSAVLEELSRLNIVKQNEAGEIVLVIDQFLSNRALADSLLPFAENLSDHCAAGVSNLLRLESAAPATPFLERAIFADELSEASAQKLHSMSLAQWQVFHDDLVARAIALEAEDASNSAESNQTRIRVGMYFYAESPNRDSSS
jgi:hypothetical protein